ncbi:histidine kinase [Dactylosporangium sp. AC04546]|uniref:sensor histidine kinase n=1 Tax=Dactylosporangium sp. AC04546 TaxID=2862460 RepID=UPI001EDFFE67|nr:histidine kinase [Dactylosporangium sp. AC04546]WVK87381.1 histidine kinase [Dactylosporangium sp. AC04546]
MVSLESAERHPRLTDAVVAVALFAGAVLGVHLVGPGEGRPPDAWIADVLAGLSCLALLKAREHPRATVAVTAACAVVLGVLGYLLTPLLLGPVMVALYRLAASAGSRTAWVYGGVTTTLVVGAAVGITDLDETVVLRVIGPALWLLLPLSMGSRSRLRHAYLDTVHARAEHAERTREEEARLRVTEERMRIARDLHDVVAHHMAVANAQAGTAAHLLDADPALTRKLLADLKVTTSSVMLELRNTVGVLRRAGEPDADSLEPAPGLARLPELLELCRSAGLTVDLEVEGEPRDLPPGVDLTAYRIIQEALTNATKYAAPAVASLRLRYSGSTLTIMVANATEGGRGPGGADGFGIIGMRERAHAVGGDLRVSDGGTGFEVVSALPLRVTP